MPAAFALKSRVDGWFERLGLRGVTDRVMQVLTGLLPRTCPSAWASSASAMSITCR